jgi:hypothetical protein
VEQLNMSASQQSLTWTSLTLYGVRIMLPKQLRVQCAWRTRHMIHDVSLQRSPWGVQSLILFSRPAWRIDHAHVIP